MILGMSVSTFTMVHVIISLIAIATGLVAFARMLASRPADVWTHVFLATTVLTSITGFMFPITAFTPALAFGVLSMVLLILALAGLYAFHLRGHWRWVYVATAVTALYLNCFVLIVQMFQKLGPLHALAPTQSEAPFQIAQGLLLIAFLVLGIRAGRRYHPDGLGGGTAPAV